MVAARINRKILSGKENAALLIAVGLVYLFDSGGFCQLSEAETRGAVGIDLGSVR